MRTALVTVLYPEALRYFSQWKKSVQTQDTQDFDLVIALHNVRAEDVDCADLHAKVRFVAGSLGMSLRRSVFQGLADTYDTAVLVDIDDVLLPHRVRVACDALANADVYGCATQVVDEQLHPLNVTFPEVEPSEPPPVTHGNVWGCSNTAYRTEVLREVARFPDNCVLADWYMATLAANVGAKFVFDAEPAMQYRIRPGAPTNPCEPYAPSVLRTATDLTEGHLRLVSQAACINQSFREKLSERLAEVTVFRRAMQSDTAATAYLRALSETISRPRVWWESVAHTMLRDLWNT